MYRMENMAVSFYIILYPALTGSPPRTSKLSESKEVRWGGFFCYSNSCKKLEVISEIVSSVVKDILTNTETHTCGIKV
ncbi:TPA: hypothetical protein QCW96_000434 [Bacillus pacificus]|nr:hypothetical protein [Bacillus pacificus]HDR3633768.1 hypothetical protein [Bacillus pacificus]HDR7251204.1 hypothetical protein [Bacillus pacificus]HDR7652394.1 hypothetical protein [Bacillus pacificus]